MKKISCDEIPTYSEAILKLLDNNRISQKNKKNIIREFGQEKWGVLCSLIDSTTTSLESVMELELPFCTQQCGIINKEIVISTRAHFFKKQVSIIRSKLINSKSKTIVELGCGYGPLLLTLAKEARFLNKKFIGFEITKQGVALGNRIAQSTRLPVEFKQNDYSRDSFYKSIKTNLDADFLTSYSLHYVKDVSTAIMNIIKLNPNKVIHLEPIVQHYDQKKTLGLLQIQYMRKNKYSLNILPVIENLAKKKIIQISQVIPSCIGNNPLMPASLIEWSIR